MPCISWCCKAVIYLYKNPALLTWLSCWQNRTARFKLLFFCNSTIKQIVGQSKMCKNIHTTSTARSFTPAPSKIYNGCSYPIIPLWRSTNQSKLYSFSCRQGNWLHRSVTVWNLARESLINLFSNELEMDPSLTQL